jgi:hypothetical protein
MHESPENAWPGVNSAYDFVIPSYGLLVGRFEAADTRLTTLLTFAATITLGAPILGRSIHPTIPFKSVWFIAAMSLFMLSVGVSLTARVRGTLTLPNPAVIYRESLHETEWSFKKNAIYFAGQHFTANAQAIRTKGNLAVAAAVLIIAEIASLLLWISQASQ